MKKVILIFFCSLCFCQVFAQPLLQDSILTRKEIQRLVQRYTEAGLPGAIVSIASPGMTIDLAGGFSSVEKKTAMSRDQRLMVASITKMFIGVVAMRLSEKGLIDLDKPLSMIPGLKDMGGIPNASVITPRNLMNHTSGLPDFVKHPAFFLNVLDKPSIDWRQRDLLQFLYGQKPLFDPGTKAAYSNSNYLLLTHIIDVLLGEEGRHVNAIQEGIISPLELHHSLYTERRIIPHDAADGYADLHNNGKIINVSQFNTGGSGNGYSGLYSNAIDLHAFLKGLFESKRLLSDSSLEKMMDFVPDSEENDVFFGLGFWKEFQQFGAKSYGIGHRGRDIANTTELWWFPHLKMSVVVLVNTGAVMDTRMSRLYRSFREETFRTLLQSRQIVNK